MLKGRDLLGNEKYDMSIASHNQKSIIPPKNTEKYTIRFRRPSIVSFTPSMSKDLNRRGKESPNPADPNDP